MFKTFKFVKIFFVVLVLVLFFIFIFSQGHVYEQTDLEYGLTFSKKQADNLGLDWKKVYLSIFDDLGVKKIRLPSYWNEIENQEGIYSWEDLDWQINRAGERPAEIILAVGARLPRWPECHFPEWTKGRLKAQIENEPFLSHFGDCPKFDAKFLDQEIALTRSLDSRPIVVTDSGELSFWVGAAKRADIFGATMYLNTYSKFLKSYIHYPITPAFFKFKKNMAGLLAKPKSWVVIEMQAEPWGPKAYQELSQVDRDRTMDLEKFKEMIEFGRQTGFSEFYLWGVEFWYWELKEGRPEFFNYAKTLFNK